MTSQMDTLDWLLLAVIAALVGIGWLWSRWWGQEAPRPAPIRTCPTPGHALCLHPATQDRLSCMFCPHDEPLPRGAPESPVERVRWAGLQGLLHGQGGRSVSFVEALRGTE